MGDSARLGFWLLSQGGAGALEGDVTHERTHAVHPRASERRRERSRRPRTHPTRTSPRLEEAIVAVRKDRPRWGPKKLRAWLTRHNPDGALPAVSTFAKIFRRHGLIAPRRRRRHTPPLSQPFGAIRGPNALWCVDFKGHFAVGPTRCHPPGAGGLSQLSAWWLKLGIRHERIEPGHPEQNGRHERMHRTLKQETAAPPCTRLKAQQAAFDRFRHEYNDLRPHEALGQEPPAAFYQRSRRALPIPVWGRDFDYPEDFETVRSNQHGIIRWRDRALLVSGALRHELLGLDPSGPDRWAVSFGPLRIGQIERPPRSRFHLRFVRDPQVSPMSVE
jgi:putative transposase